MNWILWTDALVVPVWIATTDLTLAPIFRGINEATDGKSVDFVDPGD